LSATLLARVVAVLDRAGAPHAVIGAAALAAHGVARSTFDLDLLTGNQAVLDERLWSGLSADPTVRVTLRRGDADDPLAGVVRVEASGERTIDIVVGRWTWQAEAVEAAVPIHVGSAPLRVVRPVDLILLKLYAGGLQDLSDIQQLLAVGAEPTLRPEVEARLERLPASARHAWQRLLRLSDC